MCGSREMQGRRPLHISVVHEEMKHKDFIPAPRAAAAACHIHHHQEINTSSVAVSGLLIYSPRRHPAGASCAGVGLAIVAAIQAELGESDKNNSEGSGVSYCTTTAAGPLSPTPSCGAPAAAQITSQPIPILSSQAHQIMNPLLAAPLDSSTGNSKLESKLPAHQKAAAAYKTKGASRLNSKHKITQRVSNNTEDIIAATASIFSTALSPPCNSLSSNLTLSPDFLRACFLCKRPLGPGKDIYMYRGERAFCTTECRHQQIVVDERKERCLPSTACKVNQASPIDKLGHRLRAAATVAAVG